MKYLTLVLSIASLVAVTAASGSVSAGTADSPRTFPDPPGDSGSGTDMTSVVVSDTPAGVIQFEITIPNAVLLPEDHFVGVFIDADRRPTGFAEGYEYSIQSAGAMGDVLLGRWNSSGYQNVAASSLVRIWEGGGKMTFRVSRAELGNTRRFSFFAATEVLPAEDPFDDTAPDGIASFDYTLASSRITAVQPSLAPAVPRAGRTFRVGRVRVALASGEVVAASSFRCRATLGGRALQGRGVGRCVFSLPRSAKRKQLVLQITASVGDQSRTVRRFYRVR